jgi:hypothetical protein
MYGASADVLVKAVECNRRILTDWPTPVEGTFAPGGEDSIFVKITASGFGGTDDE